MFEAIQSRRERLSQLMKNIQSVMVDKEEMALLSLVSLLAGGHVLLEDVPGVGKTTFVRALSKSIDAKFKRIQFTPDLLPSDVTGVSIYNLKTTEFTFHEGPIFGNIILADEINRTSPKTQAALLEAMEEHKVTIDGETKDLEQPFFVMATQNPINFEGTYPLPEAQIDRFMMKLNMGYPSAEAELEMLSRHLAEQPIVHIEPVMTKEELLQMRSDCNQVHIERAVLQYMIELVQQTRKHPSIKLGISPRGTIDLMKAARAYALIHGRLYVVPDDVKYLAPYIMNHRLYLTTEAVYRGESIEDIIASILSETRVPIIKAVHYEK